MDCFGGCRKPLNWSGLLFLCGLQLGTDPISSLSSAAQMARQKFCDESFYLISLPQHNQFDRIQYAVLSWKHGNKNNLYCNHFLSKQWQNNMALMAPGTKSAATEKTSLQDKVLFLTSPSTEPARPSQLWQDCQQSEHNWTKVHDCNKTDKTQRGVESILKIVPILGTQ